MEKKNPVVVMSHLDPLRKFTKADNSDLIEACGLIPVFVFGAAEVYDKTVGGFSKELLSRYGYGANYSDHWGTVLPDGTLVAKDPEENEAAKDPDLYPLATFTVQLEDDQGLEVIQSIEVHVYKDDIVSVVGEGQQFVTRMD